MNAFFNGMNLGLVCARDEAFGRVTIEMMYHRTPVIASKSGANPELIQEGKCGELYELFHPEQLADRIACFVQKPELLETYGAYAQRYAIDNFSSARNTKLIYQQITQCINKESTKTTQPQP